MEWENFKKYFDDKGLMGQLGMFRYEDANTNYLASVLLSNIYGEKPIKLFLKLLKMPNDNIKKLKIDLRKKLEHGIPDMLLTYQNNENNYLVLLEAKLLSEEHNKQCEHYYTDIKDLDEYKNFEKKYVYLTLDGLKTPTNYESLIYQELVDNLYDELKNEQDNLNIKEYLKGFNGLYDNEILSEKDWHFIPVSNEEKELANNLYENINIDEKIKEKLEEDDKKILKILISIMEKENKIDEEKTKEIFNKLKTKTTYKVNEEETPLCRIVYTVFNKLKDDSDNITRYGKNKKYKFIYELHDNEFDNLSSNYQSYYTKDKYGELIINGKQYWYTCVNLEEEIKTLKENVGNRIKIEIEKNN